MDEFKPERDGVSWVGPSQESAAAKAPAVQRRPRVTYSEDG